MQWACCFTTRVWSQFPVLGFYRHICIFIFLFDVLTVPFETDGKQCYWQISRNIHLRHKNERLWFERQWLQLHLIRLKCKNFSWFHKTVYPELLLPGQQAPQHKKVNSILFFFLMWNIPITYNQPYTALYPYALSLSIYLSICLSLSLSLSLSLRLSLSLSLSPSLSQLSQLSHTRTIPYKLEVLYKLLSLCRSRCGLGLLGMRQRFFNISLPWFWRRKISQLP